MKPNKYTIVSKEELHGYIYQLKRNNRISEFWLQIFRNLNNELKKECRLKPTKLIEKEESEYRLENVKVYQFETEQPSMDLREYLKKYYVFVEDIPQEKKSEWIEKVKRHIEEQREKI